MFKTYFLVAYRNFTRNKIFTLINVLGLSIGISASALFMMIVALLTLSFQTIRAASANPVESLKTE